MPASAGMTAIGSSILGEDGRGGYMCCSLWLNRALCATKTFTFVIPAKAGIHWLFPHANECALAWA
jgi:hypothetical protein